MPRVTVVIPTHNRASLVLEAIGSVLRQSYRDFEVIVCDDGSTDDTEARVCAVGPPVRYLRCPHTGRPGSPRNRGIEAARGELVAFLDDDDLWEADKLARQIELLDRRRELSVVYTDRRVLFSDGSTSPPVASAQATLPGQLFELALRGQFPFLGTAIVRTELLRKVGRFDETLTTAEDLDLWLRLGRIARAERVPEPLVVVRRSSGSLSDRSGAKAFENAIFVLKRALAAGELRLPQRLRCRRTLAHMHARLAALLRRDGEFARSFRAALAAVGYALGSSAAWAVCLKALHGKSSAG
jgi:glycosyltransferase involved in cell wall biosynthesis